MKQPTMDDVAAEAGVSRSLVSLVLRGSSKVSDERRAAVLTASAKLGYRPNLSARNLASSQTHTIGVMINDLHNPYFVEVLDGMEPASTAAGFRLLIASGWGRPRSERSAVETFLEYRVDGLILAGPRLESKAITDAAKSAPLVIVGRTVRSELVDSINNDEAVGSRLAIDHLVALGHEHIVHLDGGRGAGAPPRKAGYQAAMKYHNLEHRIDVVAGDFTEVSGVEAARRVLRRAGLPTAVFAANDLMASGAITALEEGGLRIPEDISVIGYDNIALAGMPHISLSTVHQPRVEMGRLAVETLLERINGTRSTCRREVLTPTLVPRATSGPARENTR